MVPRIWDSQEWLLSFCFLSTWGSPGSQPCLIACAPPAKTVPFACVYVCARYSQEITSPTSGVVQLSCHDTRQPLKSLFCPFLTHRQTPLPSPYSCYSERSQTPLLVICLMRLCRIASSSKFGREKVKPRHHQRGITQSGPSSTPRVPVHTM